MRLLLASLFMVPLLTSEAFAQGNNYACRSAINEYNAAVEEISSTIRRYANCVSNSQGQDDSYSEFRRMKSAQDDFEMAVSSYQMSCR